MLLGCEGEGCCYSLLCERLVKQPCDYGKIAALIVRREEHRVLVLVLLGRHCFCCRAVCFSAQLLPLRLRCPYRINGARTLTLTPFGTADAALPTTHLFPSMQKRSAARKSLLLCFDAFDTLYKPNLAVPAAYAFAAQRHGIDCVTEATSSKPVASWTKQEYEPVFKSFKQAYKQQSAENPNYGRVTGLGAEKWWANVRPR